MTRHQENLDRFEARVIGIAALILLATAFVWQWLS